MSRVFSSASASACESDNEIVPLRSRSCSRGEFSSCSGGIGFGRYGLSTSGNALGEWVRLGAALGDCARTPTTDNDTDTSAHAAVYRSIQTHLSCDRVLREP